MLLQKGEFDSALMRLQSEPTTMYRARFADLRGDAYAAQGKMAEARTAYQAAVDVLSSAGEQATTLREVVRVKLESLEG
mgnify:FL=1